MQLTGNYFWSKVELFNKRNVFIQKPKFFYNSTFFFLCVDNFYSIIFLRVEELIYWFFWCWEKSPESQEEKHPWNKKYKKNKSYIVKTMVRLICFSFFFCCFNGKPYGIPTFLFCCCYKASTINKFLVWF